MKEKMKIRLAYAAATVVLVFIEVLIALFVHDRFIRPYAGDIIVVIVLYTFMRIWIPQGHKLLIPAIFLFSVLVELLQYFDIVSVLGLSDSRFFRILIGGVCDPKDIACYAAGCLILAAYEYIMKKREKTA